MGRWQSTGVSSYPQYAQASTGGPTFPVFPAINEAANQVSPNARLQFGDQLVDKFGNTFLYVRATVALAVGQVVRQAVAGEGDIPALGAVSASTTVRRIFSTITTTLDEMSLGSFLGSPGTTPGGGGTSVFKPIKGQVAIGANTTFDISKYNLLFGLGTYDGDALATIPTTGDDLAVIRPYNVAVHGAAADATLEGGPVGVALGTVSIAGGTLIQTQGNGSALGVGTGTAIVAGGCLTPGAAGVVIGGATIPSAHVGRSLMAWVGASKLIPVSIRLYNRM